MDPRLWSVALGVSSYLSGVGPVPYRPDLRRRLERTLAPGGLLERRLAAGVRLAPLRLGLRALPLEPAWGVLLTGDPLAWDLARSLFPQTFWAWIGGPDAGRPSAVGRAEALPLRPRAEGVLVVHNRLPNPAALLAPFRRTRVDGGLWVLFSYSLAALRPWLRLHLPHRLAREGVREVQVLVEGAGLSFLGRVPGGRGR